MQRLRFLIVELWRFGLLEARAAMFAGAFLVALAVTSVSRDWLLAHGLYRYDLLLLFAVAFQAWMIRAQLETWDEVKTLVLFHLLGLVLEIFKTSPSIGSWSYPEPGWFKLAGVPLYSGFMYAAIGSYVCQAWRLMDLRVAPYPSPWLSVPLLAAVYLNFFTEHYIGDHRWWLMAGVVVLFARTRVDFRVGERSYHMPLVLSFVLIGFFVWVAENFGTLFHGWQYPDQAGGWRLVHTSKISSWSLLVIISVMLVGELKRLKASLKSDRDSLTMTPPGGPAPSQDIVTEKNP